MTEQEKEALDIILGMCQEIVVSEETRSLIFNGNDYVVTEDVEIVTRFDTIEELIVFIELNDLM